MKINLLLLLSAFLFIACGSDSDVTGAMMDGSNSAGDQISSSDYNSLATPCADVNNTIDLPVPMTVMSNYIQYEATNEIFFAHQLSTNLLGGLSAPILPPPSAIYAEVDNITVFPDDNAYDWKVGEDTYRYQLRDDGYEIRFFKNSDLISTGRLLVFVEQSQNCSDFEYIQYVIEDNGDAQVGDIEFRYVYQEAGSATLIKFGTDLSSEESEEYDMRAFEDLSSDMTVRVNGFAVRNYTWQSNGNGSYDILEDQVVVESGTWTF